MLLNQEKAAIMINNFNTIDGIQCNHYTAATVIFPKIYIPEKAIIEAKVFFKIIITYNYPQGQMSHQSIHISKIQYIHTYEYMKG